MELTNLNKDRQQRRKGGSLELGTMMFGKIPPQAKDLEEAVLGALLLEKKAFDIVSEKLRPESFYVEANQRIFSAMQGLFHKNSPIDILTITEELKFREELDLVGGAFYVTRLTNSVSSAANIEAHSKIIIQKFIQREIIRVGGEMIGSAYEDSTDVFELMDEIEASIFNLTSSNVKNDYSHISTGLVKVIERIEHLKNMDQSITGVPSGFPELDATTHGWQPDDLIILAARPSVGKTSFALNLARNASMDPHKPTPVGFFSLEMSTHQLISRLLSAESNLLLKQIRIGRLDDFQMKTLYDKGVKSLASAPIYLDDTAALNIFELRAKARRMVSKHNVGLIIIDYLQLMSGLEKNKNFNREQEISKISRELKKLAKEIHIPVLALSQLSRDVEKRATGNKKPQLSDLRESGAIEQDSDIVMFLYRPPKDEVDSDPALANTASVNIAKHRNGELEEFAFTVNNSVQKWKEVGVFSSLPENYISVAQADKDQKEKSLYKKSRMQLDPDIDDELPF